MVKLSIITINRNNAMGLQKTMDSVFCQKFSDFEYIVIDGASTDDSMAVIEKNRVSLSYWVSEPDKGIFDAMNKGIRQAKGEYCLFLNSGDYLVDERVLSDVFSLNKHEDVLTGNLIKVGDGSSIQDKGIGQSTISMYHLFVGTINHPSSFIRRALFERYGDYSLSYNVVSDWLFFVKAIGLGSATFSYIDRDVTVFDMSGVSSQSSDFYQTEKTPALKELLPPRLYADYYQLYQLRELDSLVKKNRLSKGLYKLALAFAKWLEKK